jgi:hypothetical protein
MSNSIFKIGYKNCHFERNEESNLLIINLNRFLISLGMTKKYVF